MTDERKPIDLATIDPTTAKAGAELNMLMAKEVMKLEDVRMGVMAYWFTQTDCGFTAEPRRTVGMRDESYDAPVYKAREPSVRSGWGNVDSGYKPVPDYSTNVAHAGELRRKVGTWHLTSVRDCLISCTLAIDDKAYSQICEYSEVTGDTEEEIKALAEALAICRAWLAVLVAKEKAKGGR